jgi:puromycin-sensitive aminopeptidase
MNPTQTESAAASAGALYRLPTTVVPEQYSIVLTPDLEKFVFSGAETVRVQIKESTNVLVLNANELELQEAFVTGADGNKLNGTIELDNEHEFARITFAQQLSVGTWSLDIKFTGELNNKLKGFYRSFYTHPTLGQRPMATTQFETTDARKAFPCFDEPAMKATFAITAVIPAEFEAISNGAVDSVELFEQAFVKAAGTETSIPDATGDSRDLTPAIAHEMRKMKKVTFKETALMSTYLVALCVGDFVPSETVTACGIDLRIWATPGKEGLKAFGLRVAAFGVEWYTKKFGVPYGFGKKIDFIAVKNFSSGAMENVGAITFRETDLLIDEKTATIAEMKRTAEVILHELAHMWFGDLVTMEWWTWLWLNESFATFMALICLDDLHPEWHAVDDFAPSRAAALRLDSLKSTHPIECPVHRPEECAELFDLISYQKGCSVLYMIYKYMGRDHFLAGVSAYLKKFSYGNAKGHEFWDSLQAVCDAIDLKLPIRTIMDAWVSISGHPVVEVSQSTEAGTITLTQRDFKFLSEASTDSIWPIPVHLRSKSASGEVSEQVLLLDQKSQNVSIGENFQWVVVNANGNGFFRVVYTPELADKLTAKAQENLTVVERFNLVNDSWSAVRAGVFPATSYLSLVKLFASETDPTVWGIIIGSLNTLHSLLPKDVQPVFAATVRELVTPTYNRLGWQPAADEDVQTRELRGSIIGVLGTLGRDKKVQTKAARAFRAWRKNSASVDNNVLPSVIGILANIGNKKRFDEFFALFQAAKDVNPQDETRFLHSLGKFNKPGLYKRATELALSEHVRSQDAPILLALILTSNRNDKSTHVWSFVQKNWNAIVAAYSASGVVRIAGATSSLDNRAQEQEVNAFFASHPVESGTMAVSQTLEQLRVNVALREREASKLVSYLGAVQ